jgi:hypothetical protein
MQAMSSRRLLASFVCLAGAAFLGGCGGTDRLEGEDVHAIRLNPTPVEQTLTMTRDDLDNRIYGITFDQNLLMANDDLLRGLLLDRPSRLTRFPVAY